MKQTLLLALLCLALCSCSNPLRVYITENTSIKPQQVLIITTPNDTASEGVMRLYELRKRRFEPVTEFRRVRVGRKGIAFINSELITKKDKNLTYKMTNDDKTLCGIFPLTHILGTQNQPDADWKMPYLQLKEDDVCVQEPKSVFYGKIKSKNVIGTDIKTLELPHYAYEYGIMVDYKCDLCKMKKGTVSCMIMHLKKSEKGTSGGIAIPKEEMLNLYKYLDISKNPVVLQCRIEDYPSFLFSNMPFESDVKKAYDITQSYK
jgi:L,D-peptidoglycan transpeptidase YkuD (ErfK/YbiS/YcfS/YnhG family)